MLGQPTGPLSPKAIVIPLRRLLPEGGEQSLRLGGYKPTTGVHSKDQPRGIAWHSERVPRVSNQITQVSGREQQTYRRATQEYIQWYWRD